MPSEPSSPSPTVTDINARVITQTVSIPSNAIEDANTNTSAEAIVVTTGLSDWYLIPATTVAHGLSPGSILRWQQYKDYVWTKYRIAWDHAHVRQITAVAGIHLLTSHMITLDVAPKEVSGVRHLGFARSWISTSLGTGIGIGFFWMWLGNDISSQGLPLYIAKPFVFPTIATFVYILLQTLQFYIKFKRWPNRPGETKKIFADAAVLWLKLIFSVAGWIIGNHITADWSSLTERAVTTGLIDASFMSFVVLVLTQIMYVETNDWPEFGAAFLATWGAGAIWQFCTALPFSTAVNATLNGGAIATECMVAYPSIACVIRKMWRYSIERTNRYPDYEVLA